MSYLPWVKKSEMLFNFKCPAKCNIKIISLLLRAPYMPMMLIVISHNIHWNATLILYNYCGLLLLHFRYRNGSLSYIGAMVVLCYPTSGAPSNAWWRHQMETFSAFLTICAGNSPVTGEYPAQRPVTRSFDVFLDLRLNKRLSKQFILLFLISNIFIQGQTFSNKTVLPCPPVTHTYIHRYIDAYIHRYIDTYVRTYIHI